MLPGLPSRHRRRALLAPALLAAALLLPPRAPADSITGADWIVTFNRPDQTTTPSSVGDGEFDIRDAFIARIDALKSGDSALLATYTFTGPNEANGAAGPILRAVSNALARGASVGFVVGNGVNVASNFWPGCSLQSLSRRSRNPMSLAKAPSGGIMHDKIGVFSYASTGEKWLLTASWNFTAAASSQQWNILLQTRNDALHAACSAELRQMLAGRFHANPAKQHLDASFRTAAAHADGLVRFAPYLSYRADAENALTDITNRIARATTSIWFALNKQTRPAVTDQLIAAADRGLDIHGVIPKSDRAASSDASYSQYARLRANSSYATTNRVHLHDAWQSSARASRDTGTDDLVHCKYMVIDPDGPSPWVIHGSANWTATALATTNTASSNDENVLFVPDAGIAAAFLKQFSAMTGVSVPKPLPAPTDFSLSLTAAGLACTIPPDAPYSAFFLVGTTDLSTWTTNWQRRLPTGTSTLPLPTDAADRLYFRIEGTP
jgi:phosphatidylserine/phosphatidylglycerophosphate/cardiolipin synthase-like enzyme